MRLFQAPLKLIWWVTSFFKINKRYFIFVLKIHKSVKPFRMEF